MLDEKNSELLNRIATYLKRTYILQRYQALGNDPILHFYHREVPVQFFLPDATSDFIQGRILEDEQFFEHNLLMKIPPSLVRNRTCIDAGANIGNHTIFFSKILNANRVIAIEPQRHVFDILLHNVKINDLANVECKNIALGAGPGHVTVATGSSRNLGAVTFRPQENGDYPVESIDSWEIKDIGLLKIDVEGMQMAVLKGAAHTLENHTEAIMIELRPELNEVEEPTKFLSSFGFKSRPLGRTDFLFTK